ncbi:MAG: SUMF1/EgtB/PvdO family nonheme iron enzyme [Thermoanaerobaculia bacterium]
MRQELMTRNLAVARALLLAAVLAAAAEVVVATNADASPAEPSLSNGLTREQMAGFYPSLAGVQYQPPACVSGQEMFTDVPATSPFCPWIEELARRGITTGCTATQYCPGNTVTRAQMAVFIVKAMEACPTLDPTDEMMRVGGVCIDKYEASIWDAPVGGNQITGVIPCAANGQDCDNIYARSVAGVHPRDNITWFQAQAALENSGKRLPTNAEWQMAGRGTPDGLPCNVNSSGTVVTGSIPDCVSTRGVFDMVGNLWEWVADWVPTSTFCPGWGAFSDDQMCLAGASTELQGPGAVLRGGYWFSGTAAAGPLAVRGDVQPSISSVGFGFRGAR